MAEALLGIVIGNLQSFVQKELATYWGVDSQIQKLSSNLTAIRAVLQDAEERQITSHAVKDWLQKLSDAAYVLDDILDACSIESDRLQGEEETCGLARKAHTTCLTRFHPSTILFRRDISKRMEEIVDRFHNIDEERRRFELRAIVTEKQQHDDEWRQTSSIITEPHIYGRDQDKEKIMEFLLGNANNTDDLLVYPVVGMGGLGKTTLARWVFNDDKVDKHFDLKIWVCVSNNFDVMRTLQSIVESTTVQNPNLSTLESMQKKVQEVLFGKRYLLVLDDVWNEDQEKWENLKSVLHCGGGTKAGSILVTTRLDSVASIMGTCQTHHLLPLSEGDNLSLFKHHAFGPNKEGRAELVAIGEEIVRKCAGSPLASKALGSLLRNKNEEEQWRSIKESKFWDIPKGDAIVRALRISYFNLDLSLRHCFSFCAIYPEDFRISKEQLIHLWMANGLIKSRRNMEVEDVGNKAWEELNQRSFFQEVEIDFFGNTTFKIHDLFHELAQSIMVEECKASKSESLNNLSNRVHHISSSNKCFNLDMDAFKKFESLRTFIELYPAYYNFYGLKAFNSVQALRTSSSQLSALKSLTHLRYLNIFNSNITTLPVGVSRLQKLQILKLKNCSDLTCLPKHLTQLKDLRHLLIEGCWSLEEMPPNIGALKCLKTLSVFIVDSKTGYGLSELHDLQLEGKLHIRGLRNVVSESDARSASLISKKDLNRLYLSWNWNSNSKCTADAEPERILEALEPMEVEDVGNKAWEELNQRSFFQEVKSDIFGNTTFKIHDLFHELAQSIMGEECKASKSESLNNLSSRVHHISSSNKCFNLDTDAFKKFESLRTFIELYPAIDIFYGLKAFNSVRALRTSSFQLSALNSLTHLRYLNICNRDITTLPEGVSRLQNLQILKLENCYDLTCLPKHLTQLKDLRHILIEECWSLEEMPPNIGALKCLKTLSVFIVDSKTGHGLAELRDLQLEGKLHIRGLENVVSESDARSASLISKKDLNRLYLSWDWDWNSNSKCTANAEPERILEALEPHPNLKSFGMKGYRGTHFPSWLINTSILSGLVCLILYDCKNCEQLPPLGKLPHLAILSVSGMSNVKYMDDDSYDGVVQEKAFKSLKELTLFGLPNLERMLRDERVEMLPHLSELRVSCVPKLRLPLLQSVERLQIEGLNPYSNYHGNKEGMASFPEAILQNMPHVKFLDIKYFSKLKVLPDELGSLSSLRELEIWWCDELESFSESVLRGLNSLQTLGIYECNKLKSLSEGVGYLTCLESLAIAKCPELVTLPNSMNQLTALSRVDIDSNMTIPEGLQRIPSLQLLFITSCPELRSLPSSFRHLTNLRELHIEDCPKLEKRCKRGTGEDWQNIAHIPRIEIIAKQKLTFCEKIQHKWDMMKMVMKLRSYWDYSGFDRMVDRF